MSAWNYTSPEGVQSAYDLGLRDGEAFLKIRCPQVLRRWLRRAWVAAFPAHIRHCNLTRCVAAVCSAVSLTTMSPPPAGHGEVGDCALT